MEELAHTLYTLQNQENNRLTALKRQLSTVKQNINHILDAIQSGIVLDSTKQRLMDLEEQQTSLTITITQEEIKRPTLTKEEILFGIHKFRQCDITTQEGKKRLLDCFINSVFIFDNYAIVPCNFKEEKTRITVEDIENSDFGDFVKRQKK